MFNFSKTLSSPLKILCAAVVLITISGLMTAAAAAESAKATVNGMVCAFCAQGIEKRLSSLPATKAVFVDLRKKIVAVEAREGQSLLTFVAGHGDIGTARAETAGLVVRDTDVEAGIAPGRTWIYIGPGRTAGGTTDDTRAGLVLGDGRLANHLGVAGLVQPSKLPSSAAGYNVGVANGFLFVFFGANGAPSSGGISGQLCLGLGVGACNPDRMPELRNWNSGISSTSDIDRVWGGSVQESAFFFFAGGSTGGSLTVSNRVGTTIQ